MWNSKRREAERERDEAIEAVDRLTAERDRAVADRDELKRKYEPPVTTRRVLPSATESNRRRH